MVQNRKRNAWIPSLLLVLILVAQFFVTTAGADDAELLKIIPGRWVFTDLLEEPGQEPQEADLAILTFGEDGRVSLSCDGRDGGYAYSCEGTWTFELVTDSMDRLTLLFTSTDDPAQAGGEYRVECVYSVYSESWEENDTQYIYLLLEPVGGSGVSPFMDIYGYDNLALHRERGPNMRVVNCKSFVSLRSEPSKSAGRIAKVPLGAVVLAFTEYGEKNGFILCSYHDEYGYILAEYLQPLE